MKKTEIISGFPGIGKTYTNSTDNDLVMLDSDSSKYSWSSPGVRNENFPQNYITHIKSQINHVDFIMVSSHKEVRDALFENDLSFLLVYPEKSLKQYYLKRYQDRGSDQSFIDMMDKNWDKFIEDCEIQTGCEHIRLKDGEYLQMFMAQRYS